MCPVETGPLVLQPAQFTMSKSLTLSIAACVALTGCQIVHQSPTWKKVVSTRITLPREGDTSKIYAEGLHRELLAAGIEHKVVTYEYTYRANLRSEATGERTVVIYRDDVNPKYPWWVKDERRGRPLWLPNGSVEEQLEFYAGRDVEIVSTSDGKQIMPVAEREPLLRQIARSLRLSPPKARETPQPVAERLQLPSFNTAFRNLHGTDYNPESPVDRKKMEAILSTAQL